MILQQLLRASVFLWVGRWPPAAEEGRRLFCLTGTPFWESSKTNYGSLVEHWIVTSEFLDDVCSDNQWWEKCSSIVGKNSKWTLLFLSLYLFFLFVVHYSAEIKQRTTKNIARGTTDRVLTPYLEISLKLRWKQAVEIILGTESIPWVRCASGNVYA